MKAAALSLRANGPLQCVDEAVNFVCGVVVEEAHAQEPTRRPQPQRALHLCVFFAHSDMAQRDT